MFMGIGALSCWIPRADGAGTLGALGPMMYTREQWKAFQEASDMSELCLRGALKLDSTKGLEEERIVLDLSLDFMSYLLPLYILLTLASWSHWGVGFGCPLRYPKQAGQ